MSGVTANGGGKQYGLLQSMNGRPMPNALKPHIANSTSSGLNG